MELHPILDKTTSPNTGLWYVLSALGECPTQRVGHTASYMPGPDGHGGNVYIVGGANPNGPFSETYVLSLDTLSWDVLDAPGLKARYEHSAFTPISNPKQIFVFGGADQGGNHNDIQVLDTDVHRWSSVGGLLGTAPSPRTYHVAGCMGDRFVVYSGGQTGLDPVGDRQVHVFDAAKSMWEILTVRGDPPKPRHGHLVLGRDDKIYIHGGMSGNTFYDDLHILDLKAAATWQKVKQKRGYPCGRAAHGGTICGTDVYLFGGMNRNGALDDFYKLDTITLKWTQIALQGPSPACRLDFAMCVVRLRVPTQTLEGTAEINASRVNALDVLDSQLRLGSAGSVRSLGSAGSQGSSGSQRSVASAESTHSDGSATPEVGAASNADLVVSGSQLSQHIREVALEGATAESTATLAPTEPDNTECKTVSMCLLFGGMDTQGEIFDDCLIYLIS